MALAQSCSTGPGEGENSCEADVDADGDGASGCEDSDCHRFELCRKTFPLGGDSGPTGGTSGRGGTGGSTLPAGGMSGGVISSGGSGGSDEADDGGAEVDASACSCGADEVCTDAGCVPVAPPAPRYVLALHEAASPIGTPGPPPHGICVEFACQGGGSPLGYCPCQPEPYVRVVQISSPDLDPIESVVLMTKVQGTALEVTFSDTEQAEAPLERGDKLRFELWDDNVTTDDTLIYTCEPAIPDLDDERLLRPEGLPIECFVLNGYLGNDEYWIRGTLTRI